MRITWIAVASALLLMSSVVWAYLWNPTVTVTWEVPFLGPLLIWPIFVPLIGVVAGAAATTLIGEMLGARRSLTDLPEPVRPRPNPLANLAGILGITVAALALLLIYAVHGEQIEALSAALVLISGVLTLVAAAYTLDDLWRGNPVGIDSHWGGLGGSLGGWRMSPTTTTLLITLVFIGATFAAARGLNEGDHENSDTQTIETADADASVTEQTTRGGTVTDQQDLLDLGPGADESPLPVATADPSGAGAELDAENVSTASRQ